MASILLIAVLVSALTEVHQRFPTPQTLLQPRCIPRLCPSTHSNYHVGYHMNFNGARGGSRMTIASGLVDIQHQLYVILLR